MLIKKFVIIFYSSRANVEVYDISVSMNIDDRPRTVENFKFPYVSL